MRMVGGPPNASVTVDDTFVGTLDVVSRRGVALPSGHASRVGRGAGSPARGTRSIEAKEGQAPVQLDVKLVAIPD